MQSRDDGWRDGALHDLSETALQHSCTTRDVACALLVILGGMAIQSCERARAAGQQGGADVEHAAPLSISTDERVIAIQRA